MGDSAADSGAVAALEQKRILSDLHKVSTASPLNRFVTDQILSKIAVLDEFHADRSHLVGEEYGLDEVRLHNLLGFKAALGVRKSTTVDPTGPSFEIDTLVNLTAGSKKIIRAVFAQARTNRDEAALCSELLELSTHPWFACLHSPGDGDGLQENLGDEVGEEVPEGGWLCDECGSGNGPEEETCMLCCEDRPSSENAVSILLEHGSRVQNELQTLLFVVKALVNEVRSSSGAVAILDKAKIGKTLKHLEQLALPTPQSMCSQLDAYILKRRNCLAFQPVRMVVVGGRMKVNQTLSMSTTRGQSVLPGVVVVPGKEVYPLPDAGSGADSGPLLGYFEVSVSAGDYNVKIGWARPSCVFASRVNDESNESLRALAIQECSACTAAFSNSPTDSSVRAETCPEDSLRNSVVIYNKPVPSDGAVRKVVSVTLKLGVAPHQGTTWLALACKRVSKGSRDFVVMKQATIRIDETKLLQNQTVALDSPIILSGGEYLGLCNPDGTLGVCTHSKSTLSKELMYTSTREWNGELSKVLHMNAFSAANEEKGRTCVGFTFELSQIELPESFVDIANIALDEDHRAQMWSFDPMLKRLSPSPPVQALDAGKGTWEYGWNTDGKLNVVGCYFNRETKGIGYVVNDRDIGEVFQGIDIDSLGLVPVIIVYGVEKDNADACAMHPDDESTTAPVIELTEELQMLVGQGIINMDQAIEMMGPAALVHVEEEAVAPAEEAVAPAEEAVAPADEAVAPAEEAVAGGQQNVDEQPLLAPPGAQHLHLASKFAKEPVVTTVSISSEEMLKQHVQVGKKTLPTCASIRYATFGHGSRFVATGSNGYVPSFHDDGFTSDHVAVDVIFRPSKTYLMHMTERDGRLHDDSRQHPEVFDSFLQWEHPKCGLMIALLPDGRLLVYVDSSQKYYTTETYRIKSSSWHHLAVASGGEKVAICVDGILVSMTSGQSWAPIESPWSNQCGSLRLSVGSIVEETCGRKGWSGDIADVRIWNHRRSDQMMSASFGKSLFLLPSTSSSKTFLVPAVGGAESGLVAYFPFIEGVGQSVRNIAWKSTVLSDGTFVGDNILWGLDLCEDMKTEKEGIPLVREAPQDTPAIIERRLFIASSGEGKSPYTNAQCISDLLATLSHHTYTYYSTHKQYMSGNGLGSLCSVPTPPLIIQPTNLTFRLLRVLLSEMSSLSDISQNNCIGADDASHFTVDLLKILLANIYKLRINGDASNSVAAITDGSLREVTESFCKSSNENVRKLSALTLAVGLKYFYSSADELHTVLTNLLDQVVNDKADEYSVSLLAYMCLSVSEQVDIIDKLLENGVPANSEQKTSPAANAVEAIPTGNKVSVGLAKASELFKNLRNFILLAPRKKLLGGEHYCTVLRLVRAFQDRLLTKQTIQLSPGSERRKLLSHISPILPRKIESHFAAGLKLRGDHAAAMFDEKKCSSNLALSAAGDVVTTKSKGWGTVCARTTGIAYRTGVHKFVIRIEAINKEGYAFVGVLFEGASCDKYVGSDSSGLGYGYLLCRGTVWHANSEQNKSRRRPPTTHFRDGALLEFTVNTDEGLGVVRLRELNSGVEYGVVLADIFKQKEGKICYPAVSPYDVGDKIALVSCDSCRENSQKKMNVGSVLTYNPKTACSTMMLNHATSMLRGILLDANRGDDEYLNGVLHHLLRPLLAGLLTHENSDALFISKDTTSSCVHAIRALFSHMRDHASQDDSKFKLCVDCLICLVSLLSRYSRQLMLADHVVAVDGCLVELFDEVIFDKGKRAEGEDGWPMGGWAGKLSLSYAEEEANRFQEWSLSRVKYFPAFVVTRGGVELSRMVHALVACVLHHAQWTLNDANIDQIKEASTQDSTLKVIKMAWKMAFDVKAVIMRLGAQAAKDAAMNVQNVALELLSFHPVVSKRATDVALDDIVSSIKRVVCSKVEPGAIRRLADHSEEMLKARGAGMSLICEVFEGISALSDSDSVCVSEAKIMAYAAALSEMPCAPWHFEQNTRFASFEIVSACRDRFRGLMISMSALVKNVVTLSTACSDERAAKKLSEIVPLVFYSGALSMASNDLPFFLEMGIVKTLGAFVASADSQAQMATTASYLLHFHILQIVSLTNETSVVNMLCNSLFQQLNACRKSSMNGYDMGSGGAKPTLVNLLTTLLAITQNCSAAVDVLASDRWLSSIVLFLILPEINEHEDLKTHFVMLLLHIFSKIKIKDVVITSANILSKACAISSLGVVDKANPKQCVEAILMLVANACLMSRDGKISAGTQLAEGLNRLAKVNNEWKGVVVSTFGRLLKCGLKASATTREIAIGQGSLSAMANFEFKYFETWPLSCAEAKEMAFFVFESYLVKRGSTATSPFFDQAEVVANMLNFVLLSLSTAPSEESRKIITKFFPVILDLSLAYGDLPSVSCLQGKLIALSKLRGSKSSSASSDAKPSQTPPADSVDVPSSKSDDDGGNGLFDEVDEEPFLPAYRYFKTLPHEQSRYISHDFSTDKEVIMKHLSCQYARKLFYLIAVKHYELKIADTVDSAQVARLLCLVLTNEYPLIEDTCDLFQTIDKDGVEPRDLFAPFIVGNIQTLQNPLLESVREEVVALCKMSRIAERPKARIMGGMMNYVREKTPVLRWLSFQILDAMREKNVHGCSRVYTSLFHTWSIGLGCSSMVVKEEAFMALNYLLLRLEEENHWSPACGGNDLFKSCMGHIAFDQLVTLSVKRVEKEMESYPLISTFLQHLLELVGTLSRLGCPIDEPAVPQGRGWETYYGFLLGDWCQAVTVYLNWQPSKMICQIKLKWEYGREGRTESLGEGSIKADSDVALTIKSGPLAGLDMTMKRVVAGSGTKRLVFSFGETAIHVGVNCDKSSMAPITGTRYNKRGEDYDVCAEEFAKLSAEEQKLYDVIERQKVATRMEASDATPFVLTRSSCSPRLIKMSEDLLSAEAMTNDHCVALFNRGFSSGIHYWSVKLEVMEWGKTFVGVTEKHTPCDGWPTQQGFGLVTYRATHGRGQETVYGASFQPGDTVGVLLDMDRGTISFFKEGETFGERTFLDMGIAYRNIKTVHGVSKNVTLYPCVGFGKRGSKATIRGCKHLSCTTLSSLQRVRRLCETNKTLHSWLRWRQQKGTMPTEDLMGRVYETWKAWKRGTLKENKAVGANDVVKSVRRAFEEEAPLVTLPLTRREQSWDEGGEVSSVVVEDFDSSDGSETTMTLERFMQLVMEFSSSKTLEDDLAFVAAINNHCEVANTSPYELRTVPPHAIDAGDAVDLAEVRFVFYLYFNNATSGMLPFVNFTTDKSWTVAKVSFASKLATTVSRLRGLIFRKEKMEMWKDVLTATTVFTRPPEDEYEKPSEIPEVPINRVSASLPLLKAVTDLEERKAVSIFGQLEKAMKKWDRSQWRRSYEHVSDKGQKRAFFAKFLGENVDDNGGPYRAVFAAAICDEPEQLEMLDGCGRFNYKVKGPTLMFYGRLVGLAVRHGIQLPVLMQPYAWERLTEPCGTSKLDDMPADGGDCYGTAIVDNVRAGRESMTRDDQVALACEALGQDGMGSFRSRLDDDFDGDVVAALETFMWENKKSSLNMFETGMGTVLPTALFRMFTPREFERMVCGEREVNIALLQSLTVYEGGLGPDTPHIEYFWNALESMDIDQRSLFINFVFAKRRLPTSPAGFIMPLRIFPPTSDMKKNPDLSLPKSKTCFFELTLPAYSSLEVCRAKLLYAIVHCTTMEDFAASAGTFPVGAVEEEGGTPNANGAE